VDDTVGELGVIALVLTHNSRRAVQSCLDAIGRQTRPPSAVLVVDNASDEPIGDLLDDSSRSRVLRLDENLGPAGGYAAAFEAFVSSRYDVAWVMDDDCEPHPDSLEALLEAYAPRRVLLSTMIDRDTGEVVNTHGWCGVLLPRLVVESVGVPTPELFWWTEDTEYLQWRIPRAGFELVRSEHAIVEITRARASADKPAWKYYYEARNQVYYRLWTQRFSGPGPVPRYLTVRVRVWRAARSVLKLGARAVWRERRGRTRKSGMVLYGALDGTRRRLGRTVRPDDAHRPVISGSRE
jgi:GT2 family glycosyltransferase